MRPKATVPAWAFRFLQSIPGVTMVLSGMSSNQLRENIAPMAVGSMPKEKRPADCVGCRSCEQVCPQRIKIPEMMREFFGMIGM